MVYVCFVVWCCVVLCGVVVICCLLLYLDAQLPLSLKSTPKVPGDGIYGTHFKSLGRTPESLGDVIYGTFQGAKNIRRHHRRLAERLAERRVE
jgi:hypothetical protein